MGSDSAFPEPFFAEEKISSYTCTDDNDLDSTLIELIKKYEFVRSPVESNYCSIYHEKGASILKIVKMLYGKSFKSNSVFVNINKNTIKEEEYFVFVYPKNGDSRTISYSFVIDENSGVPIISQLKTFVGGIEPIDKDMSLEGHLDSIANLLEEVYQENRKNL